MVLADLSSRCQSALRAFASKTGPAAGDLDPLLNTLSDALLAADVSVPYVAELKKTVKAEILSQTPENDLSKLGAAAKQRLVQRCIVKHLTKLLAGDLTRQRFAPVKNPREPQVVLFVGLQGSGKTTSIAKYAHHYKKKGFRSVGLVCADTFRAGAFDQLKQNAAKIHCPFFGSYAETDPVAIAREGVEKFRRENFDLILVDTSGRHRQEAALFTELEQMVDAVEPTASVLVMDSHVGQAGFRQAEEFARTVDIGAVREGGGDVVCF